MRHLSILKVFTNFLITRVISMDSRELHGRYFKSCETHVQIQDDIKCFCKLSRK